MHSAAARPCPCTRGSCSSSSNPGACICGAGHPLWGGEDCSGYAVCGGTAAETPAAVAELCASARGGDAGAVLSVTPLQRPLGGSGQLAVGKQVGKPLPSLQQALDRVASRGSAASTLLLLPGGGDGGAEISFSGAGTRGLRLGSSPGDGALSITSLRGLSGALWTAVADGAVADGAAAASAAGYGCALRLSLAVARCCRPRGGCGDSPPPAAASPVAALHCSASHCTAMRCTALLCSALHCALTRRAARPSQVLAERPADDCGGGGD